MTNSNGEQIYLVIEDIDGEDISRITTAKEIFEYMDMSDCYPYPVKMDIYALDAYGFSPRTCYFYGKGTFKGDPQRMRIMCDGKAIETGWGKEH